MAESLSVVQLEEDLKQLLGISTNTHHQSSVAPQHLPKHEGGSEPPRSNPVNTTQQSSLAINLNDQKSKRAKRRTLQKANKEKNNLTAEASTTKGQTRKPSKPEEVKSSRQQQSDSVHPIRILTRTGLDAQNLVKTKIYSPNTNQVVPVNKVKNNPQQSENVHSVRIFTRTRLDVLNPVKTENQLPNTTKKVPVTNMADNSQKSGAIVPPFQPVKLLSHTPSLVSSIVNGAEPPSKQAECMETSSKNKSEIEESEDLVQVPNPVGVEEEMVQIVLAPPPLNQNSRRKKKAKEEVKIKEEKPDLTNEVENEKPINDQNESDSSDENSSGSDSSSEDKEKDDDAGEEEEEEKLCPAVVTQQPRVLVFPKRVLDSFRHCGVLPLKNRSQKFPRAIFHCRLCNFHISSLPEVSRHMKENRHVRLLTAEQSKLTATLMPFPPTEITDVVGQIVQDVYFCSRLGPQDLDLRTEAVEILRKFLESTFPGFTIRPYGSCFTELGLKGSTVNIGLININDAEPTSSTGLIIISILNWLLLHKQPNGPWIDIVEDLSCRVPVIHFTYAPTAVRFSLVVESECAFKTALLLRQYAQIDPRLAVLTVAYRTFARIGCLDQPELGTIPPHAFTLMVLYYLQQMDVLPVLHEMGIRKKDDLDSYMTLPELLELKAEGKWTPCDKSLGQLWLGLLQFYAYSFPFNEKVVCIRQKQPLLRSVKNWGNRRLAVEDPFHPAINLGSSLVSQPAFEFFMECLQNMFLYFWIPQTAKGPLFIHLILPGETSSDDPLRITPQEASLRMSRLRKEDVKWEFNPEKILKSRRLPIGCSVCSKDGHHKGNCPELEVPKIGFIPPPDFGYLSQLDKVCWNVFRTLAQREVDQVNRQSIRIQLEQHIRGEYKDAVLSLFGSSCNGFGFFDSDLDLCLTFKGNLDGKGLDFVAIVKKLARILRKNRYFCEVIPISSAKVPIVKLRHRATGLESDISLYNRLGQRNSKLLATYSAIDFRVRILGYMTKCLAKTCGIGDASRGSLSSYAYTLLVIHYLQQVKPPILPVLQEIPPPLTADGEPPDRSKYIVDNWDTWFYEDAQNLAKVWPHYGVNHEPPSILWLGFLLYYAELFNYQQQVVCIRQMAPLYRLEKMWTDKPIAIEDPFNLNHNLGSGISLRMGTYIRRVFVTARRFFQTPVQQIPKRFASLEEYLFNPDVLVSSGPPPNDRGCLICGKIGHKVKDCEFKRCNNKRRDQGSRPPTGPNNREMDRTSAGNTNGGHQPSPMNPKNNRPAGGKQQDCRVPVVQNQNSIKQAQPSTRPNNKNTTRPFLKTLPILKAVINCPTKIA